MIQANYCGHCTNAKGDYYKAAKYIKELEKNGGTSYKNKVVLQLFKLMVMKKERRS